MTDRLIRITTAAAVATVAAVAAVISYRHELVSTHGETGVTARLVPFTVDGLILAASMLILDANRRHRPVPPLARWCLGAGILATIGPNQPGARPGPRPHWSPGQRLARPGPCRFLRTPDDTHQNGKPTEQHARSLPGNAPRRANRGRRRTTNTTPSAKRRADGTGLAQRRPQPTCHCTRTEHRPGARSSASSITPGMCAMMAE
jgi:hypothetical protein